MNKKLQQVIGGGIVTAGLGLGLIVTKPANAAFSVSTDVITPTTTVTTGADTTASNMAPIAIGMLGITTIGHVAKRFLFSA